MLAAASSLFKICIKTYIGDGKSSSFWTDRWLHGTSVADIAPELMNYVKRRGWKQLTVHDALQDIYWTRFTVSGMSVQAIWEFLQLWDLVQNFNLRPDQEDTHVWLPHSLGTYTTKSAYERFFQGVVSFEPYRRLWKSWAPLRVKVFLWLAILNRCWTAHRLARRGMPHILALQLGCLVHVSTVGRPLGAHAGCERPWLRGLVAPGNRAHTATTAQGPQLFNTAGGLAHLEAPELLHI